MSLRRNGESSTGERTLQYGDILSQIKIAQRFLSLCYLILILYVDVRHCVIFESFDPFYFFASSLMT